MSAAGLNPTTLDAAARVDDAPRLLTPSVSNARNDLPVVYTDGCHLSAAETELPSCEYGDPSGTRTMVLFGDSHAAHWFPMWERLADANGWRLVARTKSACPVEAVTVFNSILNRTYSECDTWRQSVIDSIAASDADLVVVSSQVREGTEEEYVDAMSQTLRALAVGTTEVVDRRGPVKG